MSMLSAMGNNVEGGMNEKSYKSKDMSNRQNKKVISLKTVEREEVLA